MLNLSNAQRELLGKWRWYLLVGVAGLILSAGLSAPDGLFALAFGFISGLAATAFAAYWPSAERVDPGAIPAPQLASTVVLVASVLTLVGAFTVFGNRIDAGRGSLGSTAGGALAGMLGWRGALGGGEAHTSTS